MQTALDLGAKTKKPRESQVQIQLQAALRLLQISPMWQVWSLTKFSLRFQHSALQSFSSLLKDKNDTVYRWKRW